MRRETYSLTISERGHLEDGVHKAIAFEDVLKLVFFKNDNCIYTASLAPDRASVYRTLEATQAKISLICKRLDIEESDLIYDRSALLKSKKLIYKILLLGKLIVSMLIPVQWVIVYKHKDEKKWRKIIPDSSVFQADPFLVFKDEKYYLFYEELQFENWHGYLRAAELDIESGKLTNDKIILKLDNHLSFPNIFKENNTYYMIPECADSNSVDLFECIDFPYTWEKKQTLIENISAVDTTPLKMDDGSWYLFTSEIVKGAGCDDELSIYKSDDLFNKPFTKLYEQPVVTDVKNARMAGHFIRKGGDIIRVSQNCGKRYGHQANFNKINQIEGEGGYKEERIDTIKPSQGALGFHTYNQANNIIVGDLEIARFDWYSLKRFIGGNLSRLFEIITIPLSRTKTNKNS